MKLFLPKIRYEMRRMFILINRVLPHKSHYFQNTQIRDLYAKYEFDYHFRVPSYVRHHRNYFQKSNRGFGEDAFHAAWFSLFSSIKPRKCLEIGVYRGQIISLWTLVAQKRNFEVDVWGVTPLTTAADSVSDYPDVDYGYDIALNFAEFGLGTPQLKIGFSNDPSIVVWIKSQKWDLIYIDGGHEYETVLSDFLLAVEVINPCGIICLDDSSLNLSVRGKFKGHPGPSKVVAEFAMQSMTYLFTVGHLNFFQKS